MSYQFDQFLQKNGRFYLHTARTQALESVTGTPALLEALKETFTPFQQELAGTVLAAYLPDDTAELYKRWIAQEAPPLSARSTTEDLNLMLDEVKWTNELVGDSVTFLHDLERTEQPDDSDLILVGLNLLILEQKWDHLNDAFVINVAHELRTSYELFLDKLSTRRGKSFVPMDMAKDMLHRVNAVVFLAEAFHRAALTAIQDLNLFHIPDGVLLPRPHFQGETPGTLALAYYEPAFLEAQLEKIGHLEALLKEVSPRVAERFASDLWETTGELHHLPLLIAQLWDDQGLLSRVSATDLYHLYSGEGPLLQKLEAMLLQARLWTTGLIKVRKLTEISVIADHLRFDCLALSFRTVPDVPGGTVGKIEEYERLIHEREEAVTAHLRSLHKEVGLLGVDYSNILDPTIEELIHCLPPGACLTAEAAHDLIHLAHRGGNFFIPIQRHFDKIKRECRYLSELFPFHQDVLAECQELLKKQDYRQALLLYEEITRKFPDLDYEPVEAELRAWSGMAAHFGIYRESFAAMEAETLIEVPPTRIDALRDGLAEWETFFQNQRAELARQEDNNFRAEITTFLDDLDSRIAAARKRLGIHAARG